jgi:hypothetical protein
VVQAAFLEAAEVVQAGIEREAIALEGLGQSARAMVTLQKQHALADMRQRGAGAQPADARADDDCIKRHVVSCDLAPGRRRVAFRLASEQRRPA